MRSLASTNLVRTARRAPRRASAGRRGNTLILALLSLVVLLGIASLSFDLGKARLVKTELQQVAEASARYAASGLTTSVAIARANAASVAAQNMAGSQAVSLNTAQDVEFGTWDPVARTFTLLTGSAESQANAVRVTARRTAARGNAVSLPFAGAVGMPAMDVQASATTSIGMEMYGAVGLDYIKMGGNSTASYRSGTGAVTASKLGNIASNGDITLAGSSYVNGNARPGTAGTVYGASGRVTGTTARLKKPLSYPAASSSPYGPSNNNNDRIPGGAGYSPSGSGNMYLPSGNSVTMPAGVYYFNALTVAGTVTFTGPATVYAYGDINVTGTVNTYQNLPSNLKVYTVSDPGSSYGSYGYSGSTGAPGTVTIGSNAQVYAQIYAPLSAARFTGSGDFYGSIVAKSIDMTGTSGLWYDLAVAGNAGSVVLAK